MGLQALLGDAQSLRSQKWRVEERGVRGGLSPQRQLQAADKGRGSLAGAEKESGAQTGDCEGGWKEIRRPIKPGGGKHTHTHTHTHPTAPRVGALISTLSYAEEKRK